MWTLDRVISLSLQKAKLKLSIPNLLQYFKSIKRQSLILKNETILLFHKSARRGALHQGAFFASLRYRIPLCYMDLFKKDI